MCVAVAVVRVLEFGWCVVSTISAFCGGGDGLGVSFRFRTLLLQRQQHQRSECSSSLETIYKKRAK